MEKTHDHTLSYDGNSAVADWMTCFPAKRLCYTNDPAFLRGWLACLTHASLFPIQRLWNIGSVLFKADSILRGNACVGLRLLETAGFKPIAAHAVRFTPKLVTALWKYSLGRYTDERIELMKHLMTCAPSYYVLYEARNPSRSIPTTLKLTELKGQTLPHLRAPDCLRSLLGEPQSAAFNFIHTADEPADVVRELGLLFSNKAISNVFEALVGNSSSEAIVSQCADLTAGNPRFDFSESATLSRVEKALENYLPPHSQGEARTALERAKGDDSAGAWSDVRSLLAEFELTVSPLDRLVVDSRCISLKRQWSEQPFPSCETRHWNAHGFSRPESALTGQIVGPQPRRTKVFSIDGEERGTHIQ